MSPCSWKSVNNTTSLGYGKGKTSLAIALHLATSFGGRRPFSTNCYSLASITSDSEGTHSPILPRRWKAGRR
jgi:hypothetical protein